MPPITTSEPKTQNGHDSVTISIAEVQEKIISSSYDKAASYTTVIIFGAYAGFFAIWQLTEKYLSKPQALWAALLILISLVSFVVFEVIKMALISSTVIAKVRALQKNSPRANPHELLRAIQDIERAQQGLTTPYVISWVVALTICLCFGLAGVGVLGYAFISGLINAASQ